MAPSKRKDHVEDETRKTEIFEIVTCQSKIPEAFVSLKEAQRQYELEVEDFKIDGLQFNDPDCAARGKRHGHEGIFFAPDFLLEILNSKKVDKIPASFLSERFLEKCLERKGHYKKGWVKSYRSADPDASTQPGKGWAVHGKKEGYHGPATYFYPRAFVRAKAKVQVVPATARTRDEIYAEPGLKLSAGASIIHGIRDDGVPRPPNDYINSSDIEKSRVECT